MEWLDPTESESSWLLVEDDESEYCWRYQEESGRYEVRVEEREEDYLVDFSDRIEVAYELIGYDWFNEEEAAFHFAQDLMREFEVRDRG